MRRSPSSTVARLGALGLAALALAGASCSFSASTGGKAYDAGAVEEALRGTQEGKVGDLELGEATCPDGLDLAEGMELTCTLAVGDADAPYDVTITKVDSDTPKIHVDLVQAILKVEDIEGFVTDNLSEAYAGADVSCGDTQVVLVDPGTTIDCTVAGDGETVTVQVAVEDTEGNISFLEP